MKTKSIAFSALAAGILCVISPIAIPFGPIPITLSTFAIYIIGAVLDTKYSLTAVLLYITIGIMGLPVFSGLCGGAGVITGPTGGFILGYIPLVLLVSIGYKSNKRSYRMVFMILGTLLMYIIGTVFYSFTAHQSLSVAAAVTVVPFLLPDTVKILLAWLIIPKIRSSVKKI